MNSLLLDWLDNFSQLSICHLMPSGMEQFAWWAPWWQSESHGFQKKIKNISFLVLVLICLITLSLFTVLLAMLLRPYWKACKHLIVIIERYETMSSWLTGMNSKLLDWLDWKVWTHRLLVLEVWTYRFLVECQLELSHSSFLNLLFPHQPIVANNHFLVAGIQQLRGYASLL